VIFSEKGRFSQDLKIAFIKSACTLLTVWAFGGQFYSFVVKPRFDELRDSLDALSREVKEVIRLKKEEDVRQANSMQTSGIYFICPPFLSFLLLGLKLCKH
jgi:hypothetical protein